MKKRPFQSPFKSPVGNMQDTLMKAAKAAAHAEQLVKSGKDPIKSFQLALAEMNRGK